MRRCLWFQVTKGHWGLAKDKASIHVGMEKVQSYEEAFAKIQVPTPSTSSRQCIHGQWVELLAAQIAPTGVDC